MIKRFTHSRGVGLPRPLTAVALPRPLTAVALPHPIADLWYVGTWACPARLPDILLTRAGQAHAPTDFPRKDGAKNGKT